MNRYEYRGEIHNIKELAEISGIAPHTLRERLRRGYSVEEAVKVVATDDSIKEFADASWWEDWVGMSVSDLFEIYWRWAVSMEYCPISKQKFSRQLLGMYPQLKTVPARRDGKCLRVIRLRG